MAKKSRKWILERKKDYFYRRAKLEGYRSRAVYKLMQMNKKYRFLRKGFKVVDLGAAPGGWLQYSAEKVGKFGFVLGIDRRPIKPLSYSNVETIQLDIFSEEVEELILKSVGSKVDVILSDLSPDISGVWSVDVARSIELCRRVNEISSKVLKRGGRLVLKLFEGRDTQNIVNKLKREFSFVKLFKPPASRKRSSEIYLICLGFKADLTASKKSL